jgi:peroxiredoxin
LEAIPDVAVLWVMADNQVNDKSRRFIDGNQLYDRLIFLQDPGSAAIDRLNLRRPNPEAIEQGVPHPTTYVLDREGVIRFVDVREDFHIWLDAASIVETLATVR